MTVRRSLALGILPGVVLFLVLFGLGATSLVQVAGDPDPDTVRVMGLYGNKIYLTLVRLFLVHLWAGVVLGATAGLALGWLYPALRRHPKLFRLAVFVLLAALAHYLTTRLMIRQPTFFDSLVQSQGARAEEIQHLLTHRVGLRTLDLVAALLGAAILLSSPAVRRLLRPVWPPRRAQVLLALVVLTVGLSHAMRRLWSPPLPERPDRPNILLLSVDSLRPDHFSGLGYERPTTPHLDRLAERSVVFEDAYVPIARTLPSWTTFLTSTAPHTHGLRQMFPEPTRRQVPLPALPEVLVEHGYRTGVVSDFAGEMFDLIDYGFEVVDTPPSSDVDVLVERQALLHFPLIFPFINHWLGKKVVPVMKYLTINADADGLARRALRRMRELADDGPFLMTVFFSTVHAPYASPHPWYTRFTDSGYRGPHRYASAIRDPRDLVEGEPEYSAADREQIVALYDGALASVDAAIGEMLAELESWEFLDSTIIVLTADHGEHLFENGNTLDHGKWFRGGDAANHIPLIVFDPGGVLGAGPVPGLVRSTDLMPTLLGRLGLDIPQTCEGLDLSPYLADGEPLPELELYAETGVWLKAPTTFAAEPDSLIYKPINLMLDADPADQTLLLAPPYDELVIEAKHRMLRDMDFKLVYEPTKVGARYRLYDVRADPANRFDLSEQKPEVLARYREKLQRWMARDPARRFDSRGHLLPWHESPAELR